MTEIRDCPKCGAKDALETFLRIDLDDVVVRDGVVVDFTIAGSANDDTNGLVVEEARVVCRDCGFEIEDATVPASFTSRWLYYDAGPRRELARKLAHSLNRQIDLHVALAGLGIDIEDLSSEDPGLALDDPDNDVIDFGFDEGECVYLQRHGGRWHVHTVKEDNDNDA